MSLDVRIREVELSAGGLGETWVHVRRGSVVRGVVGRDWGCLLVLEDDYDPQRNDADAGRWVIVLRLGDPPPRGATYCGSYVEPDGEAAHVYVGPEESL